MNGKWIKRNGAAMVILFLCMAMIAWSAQPLRADGQQTSQLMNLNKAGVEELTTLPGVGSAKAEAIVAYREKSGPFTNIEELVAVKGFGTKLLGRISNMITIQDK